MLVKYKTILYGDKPAHKDIDKKDVFKPNGVKEYKAKSHDFCCNKMKEYIEMEDDWLFGRDMFPEPCYSVGIYDGYEDSFLEEVFYCPFCSEKVEYKEIERVRMKKIKGIDYVEEEIIKEAK